MEMPDKTGEILDYETSRPNFEKWSKDISDSTNGKSLGNVRAMHGKIAAGKLVGIEFNDAEKAIDVVAKVVDDAEWEKVAEGVYTGFSVGGSYAKRWADPEQPTLIRYTAMPTEVSLVDNPAIPGATFQMVKADGLAVEVPFALEKAMSKGEYGTHKEAGYADPGLQDDEKPRYPLKKDGEWDEERIRAAWNYIHVEKNQEPYTASEVKEIEHRIIHAWKEAIDPAGPPSAADGGAKGKKEGDNSEKSVPDSQLGVSPMPEPVTIDPVLKKGMYDVAQLAFLLQELAQIQSSAEWETMLEGDKSKIPGKLKASVKQLTAVLRGMVDEETAELIGDPETPNPPALEMAAKALLAKRTPPTPEELYAKLGEMLSLGKTVEPAATTVDMSGLEKAVSTITESFSEMAKRLAALEAQPAPAAGPLNTLGKSTDSGQGMASATAPVVRDHYGQEHAAASLIKSVHLGGGRPLTMP